MARMTQNGINFRYRVAGLCLKDNKVLLQNFTGRDFWTLPGGECEMLELSADALKREFMEELSVEVEISRPLWLVENMYNFSGTKTHEILLIYLVELPGSCRLFEAEEIIAVEGDNRYPCRWTAISELGKITVQPDFLPENLKHLPDYLEMIANDEIGNGSKDQTK